MKFPEKVALELLDKQKISFKETLCALKERLLRMCCFSSPIVIRYIVLNLLQDLPVNDILLQEKEVELEKKEESKPSLEAVVLEEGLFCVQF